MNIKIVGLTGGPCAGKSDMLDICAERTESWGLDAYTLKEVATELIRDCRIKLKDAVRNKDWEKVRKYQRVILRAQKAKEDALLECAAIEGRGAVIIVDRPMVDCHAYLEKGQRGDDMWAGLVGELGFTPHTLMDRYHGVVKLDTAARGAEEFYSSKNNQARDETPEEARYLDSCIEEVYAGHQHFIPVDNSTDFEGKKARALQAFCRIIGVPEPLEIERKYRVEYPCFPHFPVPYASVAIEQAYLLVDGEKEEARIRKRTRHGSSTYYLTKKVEVRPGERKETEEVIDWERYYSLLQRRDKRRGVISKDRICFVWKGQYFELDIFKNLDHALCLMEAEVPDLSHEPEFPPFIKKIEEVTHNPEYKNYYLALRARE